MCLFDLLASVVCRDPFYTPHEILLLLLSPKYENLSERSLECVMHSNTILIVRQDFSETGC